MLSAITSFELRYHLKAPLFYILTLLFFLMTFGAVVSDAVQIGGAVGNVHRNAPYVIMQFMLVMSIFAVLTTTAFSANAIHRDFELGTDSLFFASPVKKWQYLGGRFLGSFIVGVMVYLGVVLAIMIGSKMPWLEKERLGAFTLEPYLFALFAIIMPTLFLIAAVFFSVAALTRSMMATYSSAVAFLVCWVVSRALLRDLESEALSAILDPFGVSSFNLTTRYWTVFERNTRVLPLEGPFLMNRLLWIGIGLAILAFTFWRFNPAAAMRKASKKRRKLDDAPAPIERIALALPKVSQAFGGGASWSKFIASTKLETAAVIKSIPFVVIMLLGVMNIWGNATAINRLFGTPVYPVTHLMVDVITGGFAIFAVIIAAFYAGDLVFRERTLKLNEVTDTMPVPTWVMWAAKFTALLVVGLISTLIAVLTTIVIQTAKGYTNYELHVYARSVVFEIGVVILLLAGLSFVLQTLLNNKYLGFFGMMLYLVLDGALPAMDLEHNLYRFASVPPGDFSDMNGWGHFVAPRLWFMLYWVLFIAVFVVIAHLFWVRGTDNGWRQRLSIARQRFSKPVLAALAVSLLAFVSTGCYIYYNTNVLNEYRTSDDVEQGQAEFEKKYTKYEGIAQPRITDVKADVDIYPHRRAVDIRGRYTLVNRSGQPVPELHVSFNPQMEKVDVTIPGAKVKLDDSKLGYRIYTLAQPLQPGATTTLAFNSTFRTRGFVNGPSNTNVVENGTFINNFTYFPHIGYFGNELQDRSKRRKYGLGEIERLKPPADMKARQNNAISTESDWLNLDTTVSTSADQIALAPGYLQKEWTANGRRYFHYKTTSPILGFWAYLSARYEVKRDQWNGIPIEIYYDPKHPYNVDRMIDGVKKSLDYFTTNFSPYQHKQVRILEFPQYEQFAQSFPNTIPFSEGIGFIADLRDRDEIDYVFYVTAHEVAHQWWAHQVIGANVQGSTMLVETLSQYSALMVMEKEYGKPAMQKFLRYELDRYLGGRGGELVAEMPLVLVENQQYIHYRKGSLVMYALRDYIGEDRVNAALAKFIRDHAFENAPYTTATELLRYFREVTPPQYQNVVTDLFDRITLYDLQVKEAKAEKGPDGKYTVTLKVESKKLYGDAKGEEKPAPIDDWIDIGVFAKGKKNEDLGKPLFVERRRITKPGETFTIVVSEEPAKAGIDPFNKMIDRNPKDNVKSL